jgi:hypothetical protein
MGGEQQPLQYRNDEAKILYNIHRGEVCGMHNPARPIVGKYYIIPWLVAMCSIDCRVRSRSSSIIRAL